jgi:serine/threonine protein kinase
MSDDAERYARLHELFEEARGLGAADRKALLERCADDLELRRELEDLLAAHADERADAFSDGALAAARAELEALASAPADAAWVPETIGPYRCLRRIGMGGMGIVYEALQESPRRRVAIKLLHPLHATPERMRRVRQEAELLGRLQHPGIAQIHEAGFFDVGRGPQPFFAMELIQGTDIRAHCEQRRLDRRARLALVARLCDAVHYASRRASCTAT